MIKRILPLLTLFVALMVAPACKKAQDLLKYKDQVTALVTKYKPQLDAITPKLEALKPRLAGMLAKADALKGVPGFDKLQDLLTGPETAAKEASALLTSAPGKIASVKSVEDATKIVAEVQGIEGKLSTINAGLTAAEAEVTKFEAEAAKAAAPAVDPNAVAAAYTFKLSTGFDLKGNNGGIEQLLIGFIEDKTKAVDKTTWFSFDQLSFQTGKAELDMDKSKAQLDNINEILKAYPATKIKLGGYTDNVGKAEDNKKLSQDRAQAVMNALVAMGIKADRLEAEGYGQEHPVCAANDTDECKAKNRRIDVRVSAK
ncbi:MAG: OmpA family protein [Kofleriaceae bacterium]|nr:OmpA family protein [Kofleriaceae bacterium]